MAKKKATSIRLTPEADAALTNMAELMGTTRTSVLEIVIRFADGSNEFKSMFGKSNKGVNDERAK